MNEEPIRPSKYPPPSTRSSERMIVSNPFVADYSVSIVRQTIGHLDYLCRFCRIIVPPPSPIFQEFSTQALILLQWGVRGSILLDRRRYNNERSIHHGG